MKRAVLGALVTLSLVACHKSIPAGTYSGTYVGMYRTTVDGKGSNLPQSGTVDVVVEGSGSSFTVHFQQCALAAEGTSKGVAIHGQKCTLDIAGKPTLIENVDGTVTYDGKSDLKLVLTGKGPGSADPENWSMSFTGIKKK
ncbi:hypothetical protein AKJ09_03825 [Labilithrix luteola]|uniref:Lipoprotein n=1 Tax=Labilithrix luteola TaxID=1391654 RepID=A0A0K1PUV8_9BACT|nr:hypothetical protein [Labilithrix luteola]AKU97161.1 hypothetical protein AKJ09_03825 [Labilithrix luteola]